MGFRHTKTLNYTVTTKNKKRKKHIERGKRNAIAYKDRGNDNSRFILIGR